jgi:hypothetical protein
MPTKHEDGVYLVDIACFSIAVEKKYRDTLPTNLKNFQDDRGQGLWSSSRHQELRVQSGGTRDKVRLSSKSLSHVHASG